MTQELVDYINRYYAHLHNEEEKKLYNKLHAYGSWLLCVKTNEAFKDKSELFNLTQDEISYLASIDPKQLDWDAATRIWNMYKEELTINTCPICGGILRTPEARQCRKGHRWS